LGRKATKMKQKLYRVGRTIFVRIPLDWRREKRLTAESFVDVRQLDDDTLTVRVLKKEN